MGAALQDFDMFAGESKTLQVRVTDTTGGFKDITNATIKWDLQKLKTIIVEKITPTEIVIVDGPGGIFNVIILPADTVGLGPGLYQHQAEVTDNAGITEVVFSGTITLYDSLFD
jgi:hypothetical protein